MSPALANFVFEAANFLLLVAVLRWILFTPVRRALDGERARRVREQADIERLRSEAASMAREAQAAREAAERESAGRNREALSAAREQAARLLEDARAEQTRERRALERELETSRDAEAAALADMVGRIAGESVVKLLEVLRGPSLDVALVGAACKELASFPAVARRSAVVESARPLDEEARRLLAGVLGDEFEARVIGDLGAGVRVTTAAGQVDATAVSFARRAARAVTAHGKDIEDRAEAERA